MSAKIEIIDGIPHVADSMTLTTEPIVVTRRWPLPAASGRVLDGDPVLNYRDGYYLVKSSKYPTDLARWYRLPQGGQTESVMTTETPIPPPRTKLETRWHNGRWERLTKKGWK